MSNTSMHYQHSIVAAIQIAGLQTADITSHGSNRMRGTHIAATFGEQLMITMLDLDGALAFVQAWTAAEHQWVFKYLPDQAGNEDHVSTGPGVAIRALGNAAVNARFDSTTRRAVIQAGALTWFIRDRAAADSMIEAWRYVAQIAPAILTTEPAQRRTR